MTRTISRRKVLRIGGGTAATLGFSAMAGELASVSVLAQRGPVGNASKDDVKEDFFYREDWFGEPWRQPEPALLIHGNDESSIVWYGWVPRMAQEFRLLRLDLPGFGRSRIPAGFEWSLASRATFVARVLDKSGVESAHIVCAKTGCAFPMQFAADYPNRTRTLLVASVARSVIALARIYVIPQVT